MAARTHVFQPPKGTRDFYPADMAVRRYIEKVWREVSTNHGFDEIEGPNFEHLELYTIKSGEGIVSELFSFRREGGDTDYALRPEFTPTLARMYAAKANSLPKPVKWFCIPNHFRAERPQRGRLREFQQWNIDIIGDDSPQADADIIATTIGVLQNLGIPSKDVTVKISHRGLISDALAGAGVSEENIEPVMMLLDRKEKTSEREFKEKCSALNLDYDRFQSTTMDFAGRINNTIAIAEQGSKSPDLSSEVPIVSDLSQLMQHLASMNILQWCEFDPSIVRGLAYYTGTVFEVIAEGERAIAGGGRYNKLIELFGGPPTPAVGIAMGDVVIRLLLEEKSLLKPAEEYLPRPDVFIISNGEEATEIKLPQLVSELRSEGFHTRHTYKSTRNIGKLLGEANKARSRFAIILGSELEHGKVLLKNLDDGTEDQVAVEVIAFTLRNLLMEGKS